MKIYTKTGDDGTTSLFGGQRVGKESIRIEVNGSVDELNSILGVVNAHLEDLDLFDKVSSVLIREQSNMLRVGAQIATPPGSDEKFSSKLNLIKSGDIEVLESEIDAWEKELSKLTQFILPGGHKAAAFAHHARTVCRSLERKIVVLSHLEEVDSNLLAYVNRLSDWLFVLARYVNFKSGISDQLAR